MGFLDSIADSIKQKIAGATATLTDEQKKVITDALEEFRTSAEAKLKESGNESAIKADIDKLAKSITDALSPAAPTPPPNKDEPAKVGALDAAAITAAITAGIKPFADDLVAFKKDFNDSKNSTLKASVDGDITKALNRGAFSADKAEEWRKRLTDNYDLWSVALAEMPDNSVVATSNEESARTAAAGGKQAAVNKDDKSGEGTFAQTDSAWLNSQNPKIRAHVENQLKMKNGAPTTA